jgi:hypothetical protein
MIDRKALWFSITAILAMFAAAIWRFSLLRDWHQMPVGEPNEHHIVSGLVLFIPPATLLLSVSGLFARKWFASGPEESVAPWRRWGSTLLISYAAILPVMQAFMIARTLGHVALVDALMIARVFAVVVGILMAVVGNALPKLPWLSARFRPLKLDPWQQNRQLRFVGKLMVGMGLFIALGPFLLEPKKLLPVMIVLWLAMMTASIAYRIKLRREPSPQ